MKLSGFCFLLTEMKQELEDLMAQIKKTANQVRSKLKGKGKSIWMTNSSQDIEVLTFPLLLTQ